MGRVYVAGSINMDVVATADRHPKVGETVAGKQVLYFPGGKGANQAVAASRLGARTTLIGRLGKDSFGTELRAFLAGQGIDLGYVQETAEAHTGTAIITVAAADNTIVVIPGSNALVGADDVSVVPLVKGDVAISQFEIPLPTIAAFFLRARAAEATTLLNPAPAQKFGHELLELVDILVLNETELGFLAGTELSDNDEAARIIQVARQLQAREDQTICVTLGKRGVLALAGDQEFAVPGRVVKAVDTTGAGDCFVGALAAQLADEVPLRTALAFANAAASISVQRMGAGPSMPTAAEVAAVL
ncbi:MULTISPECIES: ribokinase [Bradyrhizobium]|uniref:Ribokinase n=1 Tax=Bradyrhizobium diazoefficiens (strain JCM 10833 / BCRC 13528 / IAM 13628 / NBRC 14792 / USDA 110) TaxID=224911 RepID=Q89RE0_BRADU|nr:ribokinase [Bradyrhizobium diazoefficiens]MBP1067229.1 ribokinase [Bradyrhizobium japonicum]AND88297.1 ribokinase [Bradyrhizobium diazoefficiens USDA 110]AWO89846.1 ribokinase [Bradyrhizobium diazoefficiens]PDT63516.1 ribokinase [Bradyrhizobium diazoefficiens]QBP21655.1 ribokinase [Bradyrhizobium diazoefficiens]